MKPEDLKNKIDFKFIEDDDDCIHVVASLNLSAQCMVSDRYKYSQTPKGSFLMDEIKERLRKEIMHEIYSDRRRKLMEAVDQLFLCSPVDYSGMRDAREKILAAAEI